MEIQCWNKQKQKRLRNIGFNMKGRLVEVQWREKRTLLTKMKGVGVGRNPMVLEY